MQSSSSALNPVTAQPGTSTTVYSYSHMALLDLVLPRRVVAVSLNGFLFFGNSVSITDSIEEVGTACDFSTRVSCVTLRVFCI